MQFDSYDLIAQAAKDQAALPPAPPPKPERSAWGAIGRGIAGGAAQLLGQAEQAFTIKGMDKRRPEDDPIQQERDRSEQRRGDIAQQALDYERSLRPDAQTATTAENVVYGLSRSLTKAIGATVAAGPVAGATVFGASEAAGTFDDLRREGVDPTTAGRAAAVAGVAGGVGVVLPMMGSTLARTAALYVAGGPGGFMAQQAATRSILERADYGELAKKYDPLDPVGLTLSALIPLPFAGYGAARNIRGARKPAAGAPDQAPRPDQVPTDTKVAPDAAAASAPGIPSEAIDAALVHNLTLARSATEAMRPVVEAEAGRPLQSLAEFTAAYKAPKIELPKAPESSFVAWLRNAGGIDMGEKFDITGEPNAVRANPGGIFRKGGQTTDTLAQGAIELGYLRPGAGAREMVELIQQQLRGERVLNFDQQEQASARSAFEADIQAQLDTMRRRLELLGVDPEQARGNIQAMDAYLRENEAALIAARVAEEADAARVAELPPKPEADVAPQVDEARQALADLQDSGKPIEQFVGDRPDLAPDVKNLLIGLYEAGADGARADRLLADYARQVTAQRLRPTADVAADVVEAARAGKTVTAEPAAAAPAAAASPETAAARMTSDRVATLEAQNPDMVVRIEGEGDNARPVTLREEMQRIRQEAAEGTDTELGAMDADLVRVAAECALTTGTA